MKETTPFLKKITIGLLFFIFALLFSQKIYSQDTLYYEYSNKEQYIALKLIRYNAVNQMTGQMFAANCYGDINFLTVGLNIVLNDKTQNMYFSPDYSYYYYACKNDKVLVRVCGSAFGKAKTADGKPYYFLEDETPSSKISSNFEPMETELGYDFCYKIEDNWDRLESPFYEFFRKDRTVDLGVNFSPMGFIGDSKFRFEKHIWNFAPYLKRVNKIQWKRFSKKALKNYRKKKTVETFEDRET